MCYNKLDWPYWVNSVELSRRQYRAKPEVGLVLPEGVETRG